MCYLGPIGVLVPHWPSISAAFYKAVCKMNQTQMFGDKEQTQATLHASDYEVIGLLNRVGNMSRLTEEHVSREHKELQGLGLRLVLVYNWQSFYAAI